MAKECGAPDTRQSSFGEAEVVESFGRRSADEPGCSEAQMQLRGLDWHVQAADLEETDLQVGLRLVEVSPRIVTRALGATVAWPPAAKAFRSRAAGPRAVPRAPASMR